MAKQDKKKGGGGKAKRFGPKMSTPRIKTPKGKRSCGPLGYKIRFDQQHRRFTTRKAAIRRGLYKPQISE